MAVDAMTRAIIDAMSEFFPKLGTEVFDAAEARRILAQAPKLDAEPPAVRSVEDRMAGDIPIRVYRPDGGQGPLPVVVFFHGGGWSICTLDTHDWVCRTLCGGAGAVVVSVDYRLAPEHPYPAAVEDAYAATVWVHEHAAELGADPARLAVAGDSAGGNLAAVTCLKARDLAGPPIRFQLLIYPATDAAQDSASCRENATGYFLTADHMAWFWDSYQPDRSRRAEPYSSPIHADLGDLPPALVITAEHDPLRDEGEEYGRLLRKAGTQAETVRFDGMFHSFFTLAGNLLPATKQATDLACSALIRNLG
ncbi:alpha/beta hydrolase [Nonomuraea sediminis]|uniref:alpha/beta hydrolase n=1 Tax=Nonomuraea sediminis TaxID=2835864 RepID=UPI001BDD2B8F|nr:alpha/beta hydrolase [Nonomuraea sediminis]